MKPISGMTNDELITLAEENMHKYNVGIGTGMLGVDRMEGNVLTCTSSTRTCCFMGLLLLGQKCDTGDVYAFLETLLGQDADFVAGVWLGFDGSHWSSGSSFGSVAAGLKLGYQARCVLGPFDNET